MIGLPVTDKNAGTVAATLVTVPEPLPLNVDQSALVRYPFADALAAAMLIAGVAPAEDTTGAVPVTEVTTPDTPLTDPPVIVTLFAFCSAIVPTPDNVWVASQAVAPVALNEPSDGVECVTTTVMLGI
jgi:hypothetical protein